MTVAELIEALTAMEPDENVEVFVESEDLMAGTVSMVTRSDYYGVMLTV